MRKSDQEFIRSLLFEIFEKDKELEANTAYSSDLYRQLTDSEYKNDQLKIDNEALQRSVLHYAAQINQLNIKLNEYKDLEIRISELEKQLNVFPYHQDDFVD